jgi:hypothetical protein
VNKSASKRKVTTSRTLDTEKLYKQLADQVQRLPPDRRRELGKQLAAAKHTARITNALRAALIADGRPLAAIASAAGVTPAMLYRFRDGRTISLQTADALADVLSVDLTMSERRSA